MSVFLEFNALVGSIVRDLRNNSVRMRSLFILIEADGGGEGKDDAKKER